MTQGMISRLSYPPQMTDKDAELLVRLFRQIPANAGWSITRPIEPLGSPPVFGAFHVIFCLPEGTRGEGDGDTASEAFLKAWAQSHLELSEKLMPKEMPE